MRFNDAVIGSVLIVFALAMIAFTRTFPELPGQDYGPALFPTLIGTGMIATGVILVAGGLARRRTEPWFNGGPWLRSGWQVARFLSIPLGLLVYILVSNWLGFILTALILLTLWLVLFRGGKPVSSTVIALGVTLVVNYIFTTFLLVPLPLGLLQPVLY